MVDELILNAVKEASKAHKDLPDFERRCIEHTEKLEDFMCKMLTSSRPAKEPKHEISGFMTQDTHAKKIETVAEEMKKKDTQKLKLTRMTKTWNDQNLKTTNS